MDPAWLGVIGIAVGGAGVLMFAMWLWDKRVTGPRDAERLRTRLYMPRRYAINQGWQVWEQPGGYAGDRPWSGLLAQQVRGRGGLDYQALLAVNGSRQGHDFYGLLLQNPALTIPAGGAAGTFLRKLTGADYVYAWQTAALGELNNVTLVSPTEGQILTFLHGVWMNSALTAALHELSDVNISTPITGQVLQWGGAFWENASPITTINGLSDVSVVSPITGQVLTWSGSPGLWINSTLTFAFANLSDVGLVTLYPNQPLIYNAATSKWSNLNAADMLLQDLGSQMGPFNVDFSFYEFNRVSMMGPSSPTFTWPNRPGQFVRRALEVTNTGSFPLTWPAGIKWPFGVIPTVSYNGTDVFVFFSHDAGTTVYGNTVGQSYIVG